MELQNLWFPKRNLQNSRGPAAPAVAVVLQDGSGEVDFSSLRNAMLVPWSRGQNHCGFLARVAKLGGSLIDGIMHE